MWNGDRSDHNGKCHGPNRSLPRGTERCYHFRERIALGFKDVRAGITISFCHSVNPFTTPPSTRYTVFVKPSTSYNGVLSVPKGIVPATLPSVLFKACSA